MRINIEKQYSPVLRGEREDTGQKMETVLSEEENNDNEFGEKKIRLLNKENQDYIGSISFDYISKNDNKFIKVRFVGIKEETSRAGL